MLDSEWVVNGEAMRRWLREENFNGEGRQKERLEEIRKRMLAEYSSISL